jgi:zinc protease
MSLRLVLLALPLLTAAESTRVPAPPVGATAAADSNTTTFTSGGIRVIHRKTNLSTVVANIYLLGGVRSAPAGQAGIENLVLQVSERGTAKYSRDQLRRSLARTGSEIGVESREDWTLIGARTTPAELDSTWSILTDRVMRPRLDSVDIEFVRDQLLSALRQREDSPDAMLEFLSDSIGFAGNPYALTPAGTEASIASITRADLLRFHREQFVTSRMLLVIVGAVDRPAIEKMIQGSLAKLPAGNYKWTLPDTLPTSAADVATLRRGLPTNYVQGVFRGPPASSPDAAALRVASAVLSGRLFGEIRSRRNLTYAVSANYRDRALISVNLYVTTTLPDSVVALMAAEVQSLQSYEIPTAMLAPVVQQFITEYFLENETSPAQADFLVRAQLYRGDVKAGDRFVSDLRAVTGADLRRVALKYFKNPRWAYVGDPARVTRDRLIRF